MNVFINKLGQGPVEGEVEIDPVLDVIMRERQPNTATPGRQV